MIQMWEVIITAISSGSLMTLLTWAVSKRKRNNDFLNDLQNSINILSESYNKTLSEFVIVKKQNSELLILVNELQNQVVALKKENSTLIAKMNELKKLVKQSSE